MRSPNFYKNLFAFFRDWNYVDISAFYKAEREWLPEEYIIKEDLFFGSKTKEDHYDNIFSKEEYIQALSIILKKPGIKTAWEKHSKEEFFEWVYNNVEDYFNTILQALSRGYLIEWLYFVTVDDPYPLLSNTPHNYKYWKDDMDEYELTRAQLQNKYEYNHHYLYTLYRSVVEQEMLYVLFDGMNGGQLFKYKSHIINLLVDHDLIDDMQDIYDKMWHSYGKPNDWDRNLLIIQPSIDSTIDFPPVLDNYKKFSESYIANVIYSDKIGDGVEVDKEALLHMIYSFWYKYSYVSSDLIVQKMWLCIEEHLLEKGLLKWPNDIPHHTKFINNIIKYVHNNVKIQRYKDVLSGKITSGLKKINDDEFRKMRIEFKNAIKQFIDSLVASSVSKNSPNH